MEEVNKFRVYKQRGRLYTKSITKNFSPFGEKVVRYKGNEYREANYERSKLFAAIKKGLSQTGIKEGHKVLYLGSSHGYTPSFVSDIVGKGGVVFCLDFAPTVMRDLVIICEKRENMIPLLADATKPETYKDKVLKSDILYQDIAQREQVETFIKNMEMHLKPGGFGLLTLKARSVDVTRKPKEIFNETMSVLKERYAVVDYRELDPYEKDHAFFVVKKK